ncbi:MAG: sulfite exporter TauE/SafE family protein [Lachnospirales bacterium]
MELGVELTFGIFAVLAIAGFLAGVVTGLAGASAATVVTPLLVSFTPIAAFTAIAISLITDVSASFFSFLTYKKNGNVNIKDGIPLTIAACIGSVIGTALSTYIGDSLGALGGFMTFILGLNFLRKGFTLRKNMKAGIVPEEKPKSKLSEYNPVVLSSVLGVILGLVCGIVGAGGGLMILFVLTTVLNYDTKMAIGTSVLIMTFTALTGGIAHFFHMSGVNFVALGLAMVITSFFAIIGAKVSAAFANKTSEDILLIIVGATFTILTMLMIISKL